MRESRSALMLRVPSESGAFSEEIAIIQVAAVHGIAVPGPLCQCASRLWII